MENTLSRVDIQDVIIGIEDALTELSNGRILIVVDDETRENEGDFIMAAEKVTPGAVNFMVTQGKGLLCQAITQQRAGELGLPPMVRDNTSLHRTAFTVSVDARGVTSTGISAFDRAATIHTVIDPKTRPEDLLRPGHIFPIIAREGGVLVRDGHTEAAVDMPRLAGLFPSGILCEIIGDDGKMARLDRLVRMAREFRLKIVTVKDLIAYRRRTEKNLMCRVSETRLPTDFGEFRLILYESLLEPERFHFALLKGEPLLSEAPLVRLHSECHTGESLLSLRCDCGYQLRESMRRVQKEGGIIVYLRQEGRGIGFANKIRAYSLQDRGYDTVDANLHLGFAPDNRDYTCGAKILEDLGVRKVRLLTNNPDKIAGLEACGIRVEERVALEMEPHRENESYLAVKKLRLGHLLDIQRNG